MTDINENMNGAAENDTRVAETVADGNSTAGAKATDAKSDSTGAGDARTGISEEKETETNQSGTDQPDKEDKSAPDDAGKEKQSEDKQPEPAEDENTKYMRLMADFQNYKKRVEKEKKDLYAYANEKLVGELLAVIDNFERALEQDAGDSFKEGMEMIFKQFLDVLEKSGLAEIEALGEEFDPLVHNAVMTEDTDEYESGKVSGVMQKGYKLNGKVIRPSMVKVVN